MNSNNTVKKLLLYVLLIVFALSFFFIHATYKFDRLEDNIGHSDVHLLYTGQLLEQSLYSYRAEPLSAINIMFGTGGQTINGSLCVDFLENGQPVKQWNIPLSTVKDGQYKVFEFDRAFRLKDDSSYTVRLLAEYTGDDRLSVFFNPDIDSSFSLSDDTAENGAISYSLTYRDTGLKRIVLIFGLIAFIAICICLFFNVDKRIVMTVVFGLLISVYMWACPLGMGPDEEDHYKRAYEIANVSLLSEHIGEDGRGGNYLPAAINNFMDKEAKIDPSDTELILFPNMALYSPINYFPQAMGIRVTQFFTNNVSKVLYGGRIGNALVCFVLCALSLWLVPFGRRIIFMIITFPVTLQELVSMSPDGLTIAVSLFFLAYVLRLTYTAEKLKKQDIIFLSITAIVLSMLKIVYVALLLLLFLIPSEKFKSKKYGYVFKFVLIGIAGILNLLWLKISVGYLVEINPGVYPKEQIRFILTHITEYLTISIRTIIYSSKEWISDMISSRMGKLNVNTTECVWIFTTIVFVYETCSCAIGEIKRKKYDIFIMLGTFLVCTALIFTSLYVQWNSLGNNAINGIQGRYFTPIVGILALAIAMIRGNRFSGVNREVLIDKPANEKVILYILVLLFDGMIVMDIINNYITYFWW